jgi:anti-sigma regulatory factor (Ser/Thr protein kinase)
MTDAAFRHEALLYAGEDEFVARTAAFLREGVAAGDPSLVVVGSRKIERLREELGDDGDAVRFADMALVGSNPARIIPAWQRFVETHAAPGVRLRGIGEPIFPERDDHELVECQRHETLLNLAFKDASAFWLVCPYDTTALPPDVIDEARRSHPVVANHGRSERSREYAGVVGAFETLTSPLAEAPDGAAELRFDGQTLESIRSFVAEHASQVGVGMNRRIELVVAVNEVATNSVKYGGGGGVVRIWSEPRRLVYEIRDRGRLDDPLVDRRLPDAADTHGRGLWMANQLCDLVQVRSSAAGTVVRLHAAY